MMIKILIVDDSETEMAILKYIFESEKDIKIVGYARNGQEAVKLANLLKPNLITMDVLMPIMDGIEATRTIMSQNPIPIVVISTKTNDDTLKIAFQALEAGALSVLQKPININSPNFKNERRRIIDAVRSMAEIKVVKKRFHTASKKQNTVPNIDVSYRNYELLAIGTSVGGPQALNIILSKLSADFPIPVVVVQHMSLGFIEGFTKWLNANAALTIKIAENQEVLKNGVVYFAPDNYHLVINRLNKDLIAKLVKMEPVSGFCPSITVLLSSVAKTCGKNAIGVLLTGMGSDGAQGLLELKNAKAHTFIQDSKSSIVFGMAGIAQSLGAVDKVIELDQIANYLTNLVKPLIKRDKA